MWCREGLPASGALSQAASGCSGQKGGVCICIGGGKRDGSEKPLLPSVWPWCGAQVQHPVGKRTKVGEAVGGRVTSAFGWHQDVVALLHAVHQRAGETHTRGSQGTGCRAWGRSLTAWLGGCVGGRGREGEEEKLGLRTLLLPKKGPPAGHFPARGTQSAPRAVAWVCPCRGHADDSRQHRLALDSGSDLLTCPRCF